MGNTTVLLNALPLQNFFQQNGDTAVFGDTCIVTACIPESQNDACRQHGTLTELANLLERLWQLEGAFRGSQVDFERIRCVIRNRSLGWLPVLCFGKRCLA